MRRRSTPFFRVPQTLQDAYRPWTAAGFEGMADASLLEAMGPDLGADPLKLFDRKDLRVVRDRRNLTVQAHILDRSVWIKRFRPDGLLDRLVYAPRAGKAVHAWNAAMVLMEQGFRTPRPLIGLRGAGRLGGAEGIIAFEDISDHTALSDLLGGDGAQSVNQQSLLKALGECLRRFHDLGFRHRDLRRGNILAAREGDDWSFSFLDLNRLRIQAPLNEIQGLREVERLNLPASGQAAFFATYMPERDSATMARTYSERVSYADRLERLPLGRLMRKAWYYYWEARAFSRARRP